MMMFYTKDVSRLPVFPILIFAQVNNGTKKD